jgi:hypothetical protein
MGQVYSAFPPVQSRFEPSLANESDIVSALHNAYRIGREQPRPTASSWKLGWQKNLRTRSWERDQAPLARCTHFLGKARESAARGEIDSSCRLFGEARFWSRQPELSEEGRLLCKLELAAAEAYLDYFCNDFERARTRLQESMDADQELEDCFGYHLLHVHRIHLVNNRVKVEARAQDLPRAMELAASIYLYLLRQTDSLPVPGKWGAGYMDRLPVEALQFLCGQLTGEVAAALAGLSQTSAQNGFQLLVQRVNCEAPNESWHPDAQSWLQLKALWGREELLPQYLDRCIAYFTQGPRSGAVLWYLTALDVIKVCESLYGAKVAGFKQEVLAAANQIPSFSRHVRAVLGQMEADFKHSPAGNATTPA